MAAKNLFRKLRANEVVGVIERASKIMPISVYINRTSSPIKKLEFIGHFKDAVVRGDGLVEITAVLDRTAGDIGMRVTCRVTGVVFTRYKQAIMGGAERGEVVISSALLTDRRRIIDECD